MYPTRVDLEDVIFEAIEPVVAALNFRAASATDPLVVWRDQPNGNGAESAPQPTLPYVTLKIIAGPQRIGNSDELRMPPNTSPRESGLMLGQRRATLSFQAYGDEASDIVQAVSNHFEKPTVSGAIRRAQSTTIAVVTADPNSTYSVTVGDELVEIVSGGAPTLESIRDALVAAIDALEGITATAEAAVDQFKVAGEPGSSFPLALDPRLGIVEDIAGIDVVVLTDGGEVDLSEIVDSSYFERRSSIDFFLATTALFEDADVGVIEDVEFTEDVN